IWTCYICVLRAQSLALYTLMVDSGNARIGGAGVQLRAVLVRRAPASLGASVLRNLPKLPKLRAVLPVKPGTAEPEVDEELEEEAF
ncbi:hypothetical protein T484DRAFT_1767830, partial [Baffinella frigidus]